MKESHSENPPPKKLYRDFMGSIAPYYQGEGLTPTQESVAERLPQLREAYANLILQERQRSLDKGTTGLAETEVVTIKSIDGFGQYAIELGRPIKKVFITEDYKDCEPQREKELWIYADLTVKNPTSNDDDPIGYTFYHDKDEYYDLSHDDRSHPIKMAAYTETPDGRRIITRRPVEMNGYGNLAEVIPIKDSDSEIIISRKENTIRIKPPQNTEIKAVVPVQNNHDSSKGILTDEEIHAYAQEFPENVDFEIDLHHGSHKIKDPERVKQRLKVQIKATWGIIAKALDLDPNEFPTDKIKVWAPTLTEEERKNLSPAKALREMFYRKNTANRDFFLQEIDGFVVYPAKINLPIKADGELRVDTNTVSHELIHAYFDSQRISVTNDKFGELVVEGLGTIGNYLPVFLKEGKMPVIGGENVAEDFMLFRKKLERNNRKFNPFDKVNTLLHWYLLQERGGIDTFRKLVQNVKEGNSKAAYTSNKKVDSYMIHTLQEFLTVYEQTFGEPLIDLLDKAEAWYYQQRLSQAP